MDTTTNILDTIDQARTARQRWERDGWARGIAILDREILWRDRAKVTMSRGAAPAEPLVMSNLSELALAYS